MTGRAVLVRQVVWWVLDRLNPVLVRQVVLSSFGKLSPGWGNLVPV
jgi:hypothetical protein